jgi:hypothetical protein
MSLTNTDALIGVHLMAVTDETKLPRIGRPPKPADEVKRSRTFRISDPEWEAAVARAKADGLDIGQVIRHYLRAYVDNG